ncbi:MAG TPA: ABC transporter ATP-binding protein [Burkholderiales bacterium]|nr:ABC transporter ATP-binding protein [Burkholderiales bacterium]
MNLLEVRGLKVSYGGINAVKGIDLDISEGEMVALIGSNGAGKTTTLKAICGLLLHVTGEVRYCGNSIMRLPSYQLVRRGVALVPEGRGIFGRLTVEENLEMGAYCRVSDKQELEHVYQMFPRLKERRSQTAGTLSGGEQQMLAIGRALMSRPKLLLLDEPSMGLAPLMVSKIFETIMGVAKQGVTLLLVEQNAKLALEASQKAYVMDGGLITLSGPAQDLLNNPRVREAYLGE